MSWHSHTDSGNEGVAKWDLATDLTKNSTKANQYTVMAGAFQEETGRVLCLAAMIPYQIYERGILNNFMV